MGLLDGKVAIITGGGKGIGFGIASAFAEEGANLCITGRNEQRLIDAEAKLKEQYGVDVMHVAAEGSDEEAVKNVIAQTIAHFGKLDTVVNNAQASKSGVMLVDHSKEDFDLAINSGLYAAFFYMKHAFPELKKTKGSVVNLSSGAGLFGKPGQSSYAAAKEGIRGMTRVAATEWGPDGVRANVICPLRENHPTQAPGTQEVFVLGNADATSKGWYLKRLEDAAGDDTGMFMWQVAKGEEPPAPEPPVGPEPPVNPDPSTPADPDPGNAEQPGDSKEEGLSSPSQEKESAVSDTGSSTPQTGDTATVVLWPAIAVACAAAGVALLIVSRRRSFGR